MIRETQLSRLRAAAPAIGKLAGHDEIWGINICDPSPVVDLLFSKYLDAHGGSTELQYDRARIALERTLRWRKLKSISSLATKYDLIEGISHITTIGGKLVVWTILDEKIIKTHRSMIEELSGSQGVECWILGLMERMVRSLFHDESVNNLASKVIHVVDYRPRRNPKGQHESSDWLSKTLHGVQYVIPTLAAHYPQLLAAAYLINFPKDYLLTLPLSNLIFEKLLLLDDKLQLAGHLGAMVPPEYGGTGRSLDHSHLPCSSGVDYIDADPGEVPAAIVNTDSESLGTQPLVDTNAAKGESNGGLKPETEATNYALVYSERLGPPSYVLDPQDLDHAFNMCPDKMGARLVQIDKDTVVKYGPHVRLAEAEAMHLVSKQTTIQLPRILNAYILNSVGYLIMTFESGQAFDVYWDKASDLQQSHLCNQLRDYVQQLRKIQGPFIGGVDGSSCRDGIFAAGWGDQENLYGPYDSESAFNGGIVQALEDRIPRQLRHCDRESRRFASEYIMRQTVRALKDHDIVFTHADLHPGNMLVRHDGTVVLLDWGLAGFWPSYWEYYRAMFLDGWKTSWHLEVERFIPPYYIENAIMTRVYGVMWN